MFSWYPRNLGICVHIPSACDRPPRQGKTIVSKRFWSGQGLIKQTNADCFVVFENSHARLNANSTPNLITTSALSFESAIQPTDKYYSLLEHHQARHVSRSPPRRNRSSNIAHELVQFTSGNAGNNKDPSYWLSLPAHRLPATTSSPSVLAAGTSGLPVTNVETLTCT